MTATDDDLRRAARAIHSRFLDPAKPFTGFLVCVGLRPDSLVIHCRRKPTDRERDECLAMAGGVPLEFTVTGDIILCMVAEGP